MIYLINVYFDYQFWQLDQLTKYWDIIYVYFLYLYSLWVPCAVLNIC